MGIVGENIRRIRTARNLLQGELAESIGKSQKTISSWELGVRNPSNEDVRKMAKILGVAPAEIIGHNEVFDSEFEYIVTNDDMSPEIMNGDTLLVNSALSLKDGDVVVVEDNSKRDIVRRIYKLGKMVGLLAINPRIKPINTNMDNITIKGKVTELRRKV